MAKFRGGSCRQSGACAPAPLFYSLFAAMSNTAICALCVSAAPGRFAGIRVTGAIMQTVVILHGCHGAGASAIGFIRAGLAQAVGAFVGFIESAYLFHGLHLHFLVVQIFYFGGTARAGRGRSPAPLGALAAGLISLSGRTSAASLYWSACLRPLGRAGLPGPGC